MFSPIRIDRRLRSPLGRVPGARGALVLGVLALGLVLAGCGIFGSEDAVPPAAPTDLEGTSQDAAIALTWRAPSSKDLEGYNVYRSTSSIGSVSDMTPLNGGTLVSGTEYTDEAVENGTSYHYVVTAVDRAGNESPPSAEIEKTPFSEPPNRP